MRIRGQEVTREQLERGMRLADAMIGVLQIDHPVRYEALQVGFAMCASELLREGATREHLCSLLNQVDEIVEEFTEHADAVARMMRGPELKIVTGVEHEAGEPATTGGDE